MFFTTEENEDTEKGGENLNPGESTVPVNTARAFNTGFNHRRALLAPLDRLGTGRAGRVSQGFCFRHSGHDEVVIRNPARPTSKAIKAVTQRAAGRPIPAASQSFAVKSELHCHIVISNSLLIGQKDSGGRCQGECWYYSV